MKTAISIPDQLFEEAEQLAERLHTSRSQLYARALAEFVARHDPNTITAQMNQTLAELDSPETEFACEAGRQVLRQVEW